MSHGAHASAQAGRGPTDPLGPTGKLANWLAGFRLEDVPTATRERAAYLLLDGIGCALVGARLPWSVTAVDSVCGLEGTGRATLIGWNRRLPPSSAALLNSTFIQGFELDDVHPRAPLHSASLVLPALLAGLQARAPVSGQSFLRAAIAGFEVGPRVGLALHGIQMLSRGWHSGAVFGTHAAAAATGALFRLDGGAFEDALGLAGTQSGGLMAAQFEATSKRMQHGFASRAGLTAAWFAADGYTGIKRVYEREYGGFLAVFGEGHAPDASQVCHALGERWETDHIVVKFYATMGGLHAPIDAVRALRQTGTFHPDQIAHIDVWVGNAVFHHGAFPIERPLTAIGAQMSLAYALAVAAIDGEAMVSQYTPARIDAEDVWALIPKIRMHEEKDSSAPEKRLRTRVRITFTDGTEKEIERGPRLSDEISNVDIAEKFKKLADLVITAERRDRIGEMVIGIERATDLAPLVAQLAEDVAPALKGEAMRRG
jgi:2-methylcitrate dehydratase PrpD